MARTESSESAGTRQSPQRLTPNGRQSPARRQVREKNPKSPKIDKMSKFCGGEGKTEGKRRLTYDSQHRAGPEYTTQWYRAIQKPPAPWQSSPGLRGCGRMERMVWKYPNGCRRTKVMGWRFPDGHSRMKVWAQLYLWSFGPGWALSAQLPPPAKE